MLKKSLLRRFIVIRRNRKYSTYSCKIECFQGMNQLSSIITPNPHDYRYFPFYAFDDKANNLLAFFFFQCRGFGCGSQCHNIICPTRKLVIYQPFQSFKINFFIFFERSNQCYPHSRKFILQHKMIYFLHFSQQLPGI